MANLEIRFFDKDFEKSITTMSTPLSKNVLITLTDNDGDKKCIYLNKETAIKLVKELKRNIGAINDLEKSNGW
jgi:hypothetical protein